MPLWHNTLSDLPDKSLKLSLATVYGCPPIFLQTVSVRLPNCLRGKSYGLHPPVHQHPVGSFRGFLCLWPCAVVRAWHSFSARSRGGFVVRIGFFSGSETALFSL